MKFVFARSISIRKSILFATNKFHRIIQDRLHCDGNADFRHKFFCVVGDAIVNQGNFPGKAGNFHGVGLNIVQKFPVLGGGFGVAAPETQPDA